MLDVYEAVMSRRSIRNYLDKSIPAPVEQKLVDALIWAPSAGNLQSRKFYLVRDSAMRLKLSQAARAKKFIEDAPLVVVACTDAKIHERYGDRGLNLFAVQDVAASVMAMMLVAVGEGLGTVWVGAFEESAVIEALDLPASLRPIAIIPVGYPESIPLAPQRVGRDQAIVEI